MQPNNELEESTPQLPPQQEVKVKDKIPPLTQRTFFIVGQKRAGKTYEMHFLVISVKYPMIIIDPVGELRNLLVQKGINVIIPSKKGFDDQCRRAIKVVWKHSGKLVIDTSDYLKTERQQFMNELSNYIYRNLANGVIVVDEIHEYCPQIGGDYSEEFERLVRQGRNFNLGFVLSTQRPQLVSKNIFALGDTFALGRMVYVSDVEVIKRIVGYNVSKENLQSILSELTSLSTGQFIYLDYFLPKERFIRRDLNYLYSKTSQKRRTK